MDRDQFLADHRRATRRYFLRQGAAGLAAFQALSLATESSPRRAAADPPGQEHSSHSDALSGNAESLPDPLVEAIESVGPWITAADEFQDVSRGNPKPHSLSEEERAAAGLTRETWRLDVVADPEHPARLRQPLSREKGNAFDFASLMEMADTHSVRIPKVMTCLNIGCPLGNGIWEGVPLRNVLWLTEPRQDLRRVFYCGYHNDDEAQMFRSSLPVGRVLEDPYGLPPVILCYKLNGDWLTPERGAPVRMVVPEAYGFKSIKWLSHVVLSNLAHANDTYAEKNNDVDSPLKTFCATLSMPNDLSAGQPIPITGWAQAGISGLERVQVWIQNKEQPPEEDDRHFTKAPWRDATILPPPKRWDNLRDQRLPADTIGFRTPDGKPATWPLWLTQAHWATLHPGLPAGEYILRCRTVDRQGNAQPMPRPFRKSGHAAIERRSFVVS